MQGGNKHKKTNIEQRGLFSNFPQFSAIFQNPRHQKGKQRVARGDRDSSEFEANLLKTEKSYLLSIVLQTKLLHALFYFLI